MERENTPVADSDSAAENTQDELQLNMVRLRERLQQVLDKFNVFIEKDEVGPDSKASLRQKNVVDSDQKSLESWESPPYPLVDRSSSPSFESPDVDRRLNFVASPRSSRSRNVDKQSNFAASAQSTYTSRDDVNDEKFLDFVLIHHIFGPKEYAREEKRNVFLQNLEEVGFEIEQAPSVLGNNLMYVKIYATKSVLKSLAHVHGLNLLMDNVYYIKEKKFFIDWFACKLTGVNVDDPLYRRAPDTLSGERPLDMTSSERIMTVYQVLRRTSFGSQPYEHGIHSLLESNVFVRMLPLHDETIDWTEHGPLNERQLLAKYWADLKRFVEEQPLNVVERYFGAEVAFYFAFLGHYTMFLIPAALSGVLCFVYGILTIGTMQNQRSFEVCDSNVTICPSCDYFRACRYKKLKNSCITAHLTYLLDNEATVFFAAVLSLWATVFMEMWMRKQSTLAFSWNVFSVETDTSIRPEYAVNAKSRKISPVTGEWEPCEVTRTKALHMFVSYVSVLLLITMAVALVIGVTLYYNVMQVILGLSEDNVISTYSTILSSLTASTISVTIMILFDQGYRKIAILLTNLENPRTQCQYDNSYTYKRYILSFVNGYSPSFYIAFFKGSFGTYPGEYSHHGTPLKNDMCDPSGCSMNLFIHLVVVLLVKSFFMNLVQFYGPLLMVWLNTFRTKKKVSEENLPIWERQHRLTRVEQGFLISDYQEIAHIYGFVIFFSAAFPLAPLLALFHAATSIRVDSFKLVRNYRRPIPMAVPGLLAWENIFKATTHFGVVVNAFVIAFTMSFIPTEIHNRHLHGPESFVHGTLSIFATKDYKYKGNVTHPEYCYYRGKRHGPDHPRKYQLTIDFWFEMAVKLMFIVVYEHLILAVTGVLGYSIPDVPRTIRERAKFEKMKLMKKNLAAKKLDIDNELLVVN